MKLALRPINLILPLLIAQAAPTMAAQEPARASTSGSITEIVLERTPCDGSSCTAYTLVLHPNGKAEYTGRKSGRDIGEFASAVKNTRLIGEFVGTFPPGDFDRLAHWLVTEGLFQLEPQIDGIVTGDSQETIRITRAGQSKSIVTFVSLQSMQLWAMGNLIRSVAEDIQWQPAHSGVRGQVLTKHPGEDWRPQAEESIWVKDADTQGSRMFQADHEGRYEINLSPGTYIITWRLNALDPVTVVVEPDRFTEANLRLDVAARNARTSYRDPPPPPGDGLYLSASGAGTWMISNGNEQYRLGDKANLVIEAKQIVAEGPDNAMFRLALTVPYESPSSLYLVVGDTAYRLFGTSSRGRESPVISFRIAGEERAREVARFFDIPVSFFSRPDYKLSVSLAPTKKSFRRGEAVTATLRIVNNGTDFIEFANSGSERKRDDYTFTARRSDLPVTDISFPGDRGGTTNMQYLAPRASFEDTVNLSKWFEFKEAGSYEIHGSYKLKIQDPRNNRIGLNSWTENAEADFTVVID